jgi:hypothetical protein
MKGNNRMYQKSIQTFDGQASRTNGINPLKKLLAGNRQGFGTLEVVIIIAVLLTIALIFRHSLLSFATNLIDTVFNNDSVIQDIAISNIN